MGISTQSKVAFICRDDESEWAAPFTAPPTPPAVRTILDVPGAGYWEHEDNMAVPIYGVDVRNEGRVIVLDTDYYGIIGPARMDLPVSLQAVVCQSYSVHDEPQEPIYAVCAEHIRSHDFDDKNEVVKQHWFNLEETNREYYSALECIDYTEAEEALLDIDTWSDGIRDKLSDRRETAFEELITQVVAMKDLTAPFVSSPVLATVSGYLKSIDCDEADTDFWTEDPGGCLLPPLLEYTNTEVIGLPAERYTIDLTEVLPESIASKVAEYISAEQAAIQAKEDKYAYLKPTVIGRSRYEIREAFLQASMGGIEDSTGIWTLLKTKAGTSAYPKPGPEMQRLVAYIASRLERPQSHIAGELESSTEGVHIFNLIDYLVLNRKWERFELSTEASNEEVKPEKPKRRVKDLENIDENYNMLVLISEEDYNDCISGDPDEEREWEPVINQATKTEYWRFKSAKSFIDENGERLSEEEHAKKYKMSLDVVTFVECCYSPKWADGFDYYEVWEACMSDGSIDGDEVDVDQLSQMIKDRKYWCGDNGGYVVMTDKYIADKEADDKSFEDYKKW